MYISNIETNGIAQKIGGDNFETTYISPGNLILMQKVTFAAGESRTYDISTWLPYDDDHQYTVVFMCCNYSIRTPGAWAGLKVSSSLGEVETIKGITRRNSQDRECKTGYIPVSGKSRSITITNTDAEGLLYVFLKGYYRVGKNGTEKNYLSELKVRNDIIPIGGNNFNGEYVLDNLILQRGVNIAHNGYNSFSLEDYLPKDNSAYMIYVDSWAGTGSAVTNSIRIKAVNGPNNVGQDFYLCDAITRANIRRWAGGCAQIPIKVGRRYLTIINTGSANAESNITLRGYRRLALNVPNKRYIESIENQETTLSIGGSNFDGMWVYKPTNLFEINSLVDQQEYTISLSSILPDDGFNYELLVVGTLWSPDGVQVHSEMYIGSTVANYMMLVKTQSNYNNQSHYTMSPIIIPVGKDRVLKIKNACGVNTGAASIMLRFYKRLGRNK